jgi:SAM-dependent methyltransferase
MNNATWLTDLLNEEIDKAINNDVRTTATTFLGWPKDRIFRDVIGGGQADFDADLGHLTGDDRAMLYARYNQRRHLDELAHAFRHLLGVESDIARPTVIDLGCGPFTAGLSFAAMLGAAEPFRYFGVDRAAAMLQLARRLADAARTLGAFHPGTTISFGQELASVNFGPVRDEWTVVVASYLLASPTLDVESLVGEILVALDRVGPGPVAVLYTNSANANARAKFPAFRDSLMKGGFNVIIEDIERFTDTSKPPTDVHYALLHRPARMTIELTRAR